MLVLNLQAAALDEGCARRILELVSRGLIEPHLLLENLSCLQVCSRNSCHVNHNLRVIKTGALTNLGVGGHGFSTLHISS